MADHNFSDGGASWHPALRPHTNAALANQASVTQSTEDVAGLEPQEHQPRYTGEAGMGADLINDDAIPTLQHTEDQSFGGPREVEPIEETAHAQQAWTDEASYTQSVEAVEAGGHLVESYDLEPRPQVVDEERVESRDVELARTTEPLLSTPQTAELDIRDSSFPDAETYAPEPIEAVLTNLIEEPPQVESIGFPDAQIAAEKTHGTEQEMGTGVHYEYQGEETEADKALDEAVTAPMLQDEEEMPTPGWDSADLLPERTIGELGGIPIDSSQPLYSLESVEESNDTSGAGFEWGHQTGDSDFDQAFEAFGAKDGPVDTKEDTLEAFDVSGYDFASMIRSQNEAQSSQAFAADLEPSESNPNAGDGAKDDDIADLWKAALADDEFLDNGDSLDPSAFFGDDGEGFLEDLEPSQQIEPSPELAPAQQPIPSSSQYLPQQIPQPVYPQSQQHGASGPQFYDQTNNPRAASTPSSELYSGFGVSSFAQPRRPAPPSSTKSFVDSKSGYSSPYDLPMDIVKPRKRPTLPTAPSAQPASGPPPRTSSFPSPIAGPLPGQPHSPSSSVTSPPPMGQSMHTLPPRTSSQPENSQLPTMNKDASGFFADLPMASKPRGRPSGAYAPAPNTSAPRPGVAPPPMSRGPSQLASPPMTVQSPPGQTEQILGGLTQPERLPLLPDTISESQVTPPHAPMAPPAPSRYSPIGTTSAPASSMPASNARFSPMPPAPPVATSRYSPSPTSQAPAPPLNRYASTPSAPLAMARAQPFIPKTSSPLAYIEKPGEEDQRPPTSVRTVSYQPMAANPLPQENIPRDLHSGYPPSRTPDRVLSPSKMDTYSPSSQASTQSQPPPPSSRYAPSMAPAADLQVPPRRPRTQSPGAVMKGPRATLTATDRPTSALETAGGSMTPGQISQRASLPHKRQFSADLSFAVPEDERAADPLERYKGYPVFRWGSSGSLVSTFPKQAPFYAAGHAIPVVTCTAGPVIIHNVKETFPLNDRDAKFPGPLNGKGKGKKKDVLAWLGGKIEDLERSLEGSLLDLAFPTELKKRAEEKVILWRMVRLLLEHDNVLEGKAGADAAARLILVPNAAREDFSTSANGDAEGRGLQHEPPNVQALPEIRKHLLQGEREKAVWYAVEQRLWSHALLLSSTLGPDVWKQVVQEFVKAQVKGSGEHAQSLAALYEVFAGNWEESVDELVPLSARSGFQMVNKKEMMGSNSKNPLDGLEQWRETLSLIISNRSTNDGQAIAALGRLLAGYGRVEAAHTCFLFARTFVKHSGADDAESTFVLLGADHKNQTVGTGSNLDAIMLTEVYEYSLSLAPAPGLSPIIPHLQAYKLVHAYELAEHGMRSEAQSYCDGIIAAIRATTRASPYYHGAFTASVEDLSRCLSQSPQTSSSGAWISKLSSDKVSGSMWKRFNTFVAGEENDAASTGSVQSNGADVPGPFSRVTGDTPTMSRTGSATDLYSAMTMNGAMGSQSLGSSPTPYAAAGYGVAQPQAAAAGRYAPQFSSAHAPLQQPAGPVRTASTPYGAYMPRVQPIPETHPSHGLPIPRPDVTRAVSDYSVPYSQNPSRSGSVHDSAAYEPGYQLQQSVEQNPESSPYQPSLGTQNTAELNNGYSPMVPISEPSRDSPGYDYEPSTSSYEPPASSYAPPASSYEPSTSSYEPPVTSYGPPTSSFEPPSNSYEPPASHEPLVPEATQQTNDAETLDYAPPSYVPYEPDFGSRGDEPDSPVTTKKKSFMDDDGDDIASEQDVLRKVADKAKADKEADDAFKKAAEADAARDKAAKEAAAKGGWLKGWFGGKKDPNAPEVHRAKLGEESSFYYDPELKKWVNKKGGTAETTPAATPPPPRGPPSRTVSGTMGAPPSGPPSGPPSRIASGAGIDGGPPMSRPSTSGTGSAPAMQMPIGSGPPSRAGTPASGDASPMAAGLNGLEPPSRPPTSMSTASSIDDLLGAPQARKGGTVKGKKRGGRYVDVMAK